MRLKSESEPCLSTRAILRLLLLLCTLLCLLSACAGTGDADRRLDRFIRAKHEVIAHVPEFYQNLGRKRRKGESHVSPEQSKRVEAVIKPFGFGDLIEYVDLESKIAMLSFREGAAEWDAMLDLWLDGERKSMARKLKDPSLSPARRAQLENCLKSKCKDLEKSVQDFKRIMTDAESLPGLAVDPAFKRAFERRQADLNTLNEALLKLTKTPVPSGTARR